MPRISKNIKQEHQQGHQQEQPKCDQYEFSLKPKGDYMMHAQHLSVSFCTTFTKKRGKRQQKRNMDCPIFNKDGNHATPTFILSSQKVYYSQRGDKIRQDHEQKMLDYTDQKSSLNIPKPRSKSSYCSVCRQNYDDYLAHIDGIMHHKKISQSQFNRYILQLADRNDQSTMRLDEQQKWRSKIIRPMENLYHIEGYSDDVEIISNPYKRIKTNEAQLQLEQPQMITGPMISQTNCFKPFSSTYQDQVNQLALNYSNYNMSMFINPNPYFSLFSSFKIPFEPYLPLSYLSYSSNLFNQNNPAPKQIPCIVIDE